jgi:hypothetical protein
MVVRQRQQYNLTSVERAQRGCGGHYSQATTHLKHIHILYFHVWPVRHSVLPHHTLIHAGPRSDDHLVVRGTVGVGNGVQVALQSAPHAPGTRCLPRAGRVHINPSARFTCALRPTWLCSTKHCVPRARGCSSRGGANGASDATTHTSEATRLLQFTVTRAPSLLTATSTNQLGSASSYTTTSARVGVPITRRHTRHERFFLLTRRPQVHGTHCDQVGAGEPAPKQLQQ